MKFHYKNKKTNELHLIQFAHKHNSNHYSTTLTSYNVHVYIINNSNLLFDSHLYDK